MDRAARLIIDLDLAPHPEGGHYRETYRSRLRVRRGDADRCALTTIHFLLRAGEISRWHVVASDEAWHFGEGDPLELLVIDPQTPRCDRIVLGPVGAARTSAHVVPAGHWQAARPLGAYSLVSCTVGPGFDFEDFTFVADLDVHRPVFEGPRAAFVELL